MPLVTEQDSTLVREREGVWVKYQEGELKIARMGNPLNKRVFNRLRAPYKRAIERGTLSDEQQAQILARTYAESLLLDWRNMTDAAGSEVPYSVDLATDVLMVDMDLREFVTQVAQEAALFRQEEIKERGKGSPKKSDG